MYIAIGIIVLLVILYARDKGKRNDQILTEGGVDVKFDGLIQEIKKMANVTKVVNTSLSTVEITVLADPTSQETWIFTLKQSYNNMVQIRWKTNSNAVFKKTYLDQMYAEKTVLEQPYETLENFMSYINSHLHDFLKP